jgi:Zn-dependent protease with chaperone function
MKQSEPISKRLKTGSPGLRHQDLRSWLVALAFFLASAAVLFGLLFELFTGSFWGWLPFLHYIVLGGFVIALLTSFVLAPAILSRGIRSYENSPEALARMLERLSSRCGFRKPPKFMFQDTPEANAAAYQSILGRRVVVTRGLVELYQAGKITDDEMEAILAHELGHLKYFHTLKRGLVLSWSSVFYYVGIGMMAGGTVVMMAARKTEYKLGGAAAAFLGAIILLVSLIAKAIGFVNLRRHEYEADAYSTAVKGTHLASALQKMEQHNTALREVAKILPDGDSWTVRPKAVNWVERLFDTHPSTAKRIERIKTLSATWGVSG